MIARVSRLTPGSRLGPRWSIGLRKASGHGVSRGTILDARAGEIVGLVDEVVGEVTLAVRNTPPVPRPSRSEDDLELAVFDDLIGEIGQTITQSALSVLEKHPAKQVSRELGSEAAMLAALKFAALAAYTGNVGLNDAQDELRMAMAEVMNKVRASAELARRPSLNS